jgi:hypothetical protein
MPDELTIAEIQQAVFEYRANFKEPDMSIWYGERQGQTLKALQQALSRWNVSFENVTWSQTAKNMSEFQCTFGVPSLFSSIQVGIVGVTMNAFNPDWSRAPMLVELFQTAADTIKRNAQQDFQSQQITLAFHVKAAAKSFKEILGQFVNEKALGVENAAMYGVSVYTKDYSFVVDASAVLQGGAFIKLIRNFASEKRFEEMAKTLYADEETVLGRLGMKLQ